MRAGREEGLKIRNAAALKGGPQRQPRGRVQGDSIGRALLHPVRSVPLAFLAVILLGSGLLMLPAARTAAEADPVLPALFTAVSAVCVTGLITVDTPTFWTPFGHAVILGLIQVGGFGIMTLATLLALLVRKSIGLRGHLVAQSETHTLNFGDVRSVLFRVARIMVFFEAVTAGEPEPSGDHRQADRDDYPRVVRETDQAVAVERKAGVVERRNSVKGPVPECCARIIVVGKPEADRENSSTASITPPRPLRP